jgi:DNA polymerase I-like protein with 3'-5' exonuclease and polymerase domains
MIAQAIANPDLPKGLDFITSIYTHTPYYKDEGKKWFKLGGSWQDFYLYNAKDSAVLDIAFPAQLKELQRQQNLEAYRRQARLIEPLIYMQARGMRVAIEELRVASENAGVQIAALEDELQSVCGFSLNANSPKQLKEFFYDTCGYKPYINRKTGGVSADRDALKRLSRKGDKVAPLILKIRSLKKLKGTYLDVKLDTDGRLRCAFNPVGTTSGRLSSSQTIFGTGCLRPEAEVLTKDGWQRLDQLREGKEVLQWHQNGKLDWCVPKILKFDWNAPLIKADAVFHKCSYTPNHRVPTIHPSHKSFNVLPASVLSTVNNTKIPVSGVLSEGADFPHVRILAMIQADGYIELCGNIRFSFTKERKILRFLALAEMYGIEYTEQKDRPGYRRFCISVKSARPYINFFNVFDKGKAISGWVLLLSAESRLELLDELQHWDATIRGKSYIYFTINKEQALWVQTLAHITGYSASVRVVEDNGPNAQPLYNVNIKPRTETYSTQEHFTTEQYTGQVWCLQTESSFFLVRSEGTIFVTGNSNMQNLPLEFRQYLLFDPEHLGYQIDLSQAENRVVAYIAPDSLMQDAFESGVDIHRLTASLIFGKDYNEISDEPGSSPIGGGIYSERFWGKKANHGLNYDLGYKTFAFYYEIPEVDARFIVEQYHRAYPGVRQYHAWLRNQLAKNRTLVNTFGRHRLFLDRWGDQMWKEAYSYIPQSSVAEKLNLDGVCPAYYNEDLLGPVDLLNQVHDSIWFQIPLSVPLSQHAEIVWDLKSRLESPIPWRAKEFSIPADVECSPNNGNVGKESEHNPRGLHKCKAKTKEALLEEITAVAQL